MNKRSTFRVIALVFLLTLSTLAQDKTLTADEVMQKTVDKLARLKTISYDYRRELNYSSEGFFHELKAVAYLDLTSKDKVLGARFQFSGGGNFAAFNGSELFDLNGKNKTVRVIDKPRESDLTSNSYLVNSPITLKNILPKILADKTVPRGVVEVQIDKKDFYVVEFVLDKFGIDLFGEFAKTPLTRKITYRITISKDDLMPVEVLQKNGDVDLIKTSFSNINQNPAAPAENSWYYSTYLNEYKFAEPSKDNLIKAGAVAPEIKLPSFESGGLTSLADHKGKVVLLEFWIFHCGACQAAVSPLNALQEKYKKRDLKLLSVNIYDSKELIGLFVRSKGARYPILYEGEAAAKEYGVDRYPIVVLIGKDGKVIYSGLFEAEKIDALIERNL